MTLLEVLEKLDAGAYARRGFRRRRSAPERRLARCRRGGTHRLARSRLSRRLSAGESPGSACAGRSTSSTTSTPAPHAEDFAAARHERRTRQDAQGTAALQVRRGDLADAERRDPGRPARTQAGRPRRLSAHPADSPPTRPAANGKTRTTCTPTTCSTWRCLPAS